MKKLLSGAPGFFKEEEGASAVEYAILVSLIAVIIFATVTLVGIKVESLYNKLCAGMSNGTCQ